MCKMCNFTAQANGWKVLKAYYLPISGSSQSEQMPRESGLRTLRMGSWCDQCIQAIWKMKIKYNKDK